MDLENGRLRVVGTLRRSSSSLGPDRGAGDRRAEAVGVVV